MTSPRIPIPEMAAQDAVALPSHPLDDVMSRALESTNGLKITCADAKDAIAKRFKYYSRRQRLQRAGIHSFDSLIIQIDGHVLKMVKEFDPTIEEL